MPRGAMNNYSNRPKFGQIIAVQLCAKGKSQKWLSEQCGVTQAHISMVLSGIESSALINALFEAS